MQLLDRKQSVVLLVSFNLEIIKDGEAVCAILTLRHTLLRCGLDCEKEVKDNYLTFPSLFSMCQPWNLLTQIMFRML